jgi:hypothetical protein
MNIVYSTNEFDIYQDKRKKTLFSIMNNNNTSLTLSHNKLFKPLFNSIIETKLINNPTMLTQNNETKSIVFKALSIEYFEQFKDRYTKINGSNKLPYELLLNIIYSLSKQISYLLNNESKCFYKLDVSNILVIDDSKFIYLSYQDLKDVKDKNIYIYTPISKTQGYLSPELKISNSIPILISYKTIFYSLGSFILDNIDVSNQQIIQCSRSMTDKEFNPASDGQIQILNGINQIKDTKLYYFLKRCLCNEPDNRFLLYI